MKHCEEFPICDFCVHYDFNGDEQGAYTDEGRCVHPAHPHPAEPDETCADFKCQLCSGDSE